MKKFIVFALVLIDLGLFAQDTSYLNQKPKTQIQKFDLKLGSILKRQYFDVYQSGWLGDRKLNFRLLNIRDAGTGESLWGLIVNIEFSSSRYSSNYSVYIDEDELPSIEKFIDFLAKNDSIVINTYTEYIYNFKEFQIYAYNNKNYKKQDKSIVKVSKSEGADAKSDPKSGKIYPKKNQNLL